MSAYICELETFARVREGLKVLATNDLERKVDQDNFILALMKENCLSVKYRYPNSYSKMPVAELENTVLEDLPAVPTPSKLQFLKTLDCIHYQSCEHWYYLDSEKVRIQLERLRGFIAFFVISELLSKEYNNAEWG